MTTDSNLQLSSGHRPMDDEPPVNGPETPILIESAASAVKEKLVNAEAIATQDANLAKRFVMLSPKE
jgi:hypothetical protein